MIVYPAMDLMGGRCVRLAQGRFDEATVYAGDPAEALAGFAAAGAEWAHVVDLDGARAGRPVQHDLVASLAGRAPLKLQVAGGFRDAVSVAAALGFLALVWRIARYGNIVVFGVAVMLYAACYINLFGPRNEFLSYMVFTPALTGVALMLLRRNSRDHRAWLLIVVALVIDFHGALAVDRVLKPALAFIVLGWMIYMTVDMRRWVELLGRAASRPD